MRSQSGSGVLNAVVGIALVSTLSLVYADVYSSLRKVQAKTDFLTTVLQIQTMITNTVNDANSWSNTTGDSAHNSSMVCLIAHACTAAVGPTPFALWAAGERTFLNTSLAVYDGTNPSAGFKLSGQACSTFSLSGNSDCPIHVSMTWSTPGCSPIPCQASVTITADILYRPGASSPFGTVNESQYTLHFQQSNSANDPCGGSVAPAEEILCATPPYPDDSLICTGTGYRCGQVFR